MAADGSGRLLALANSIKARQAGRADSLLWLEETDLGQEVWRLDFGEHDTPTMFVNKNIPRISDVASKDHAFRSLVVPEALRSILTRALIVDEYDDDDDASKWDEWLAFVREFYKETIPGASDDKDKEAAARREWIDEAVKAFADKRFHASDQYSTTRGQ